MRAKKWHYNIRLNNTHSVRQSCYTPNNTSRVISINYHPFLTYTGDPSGKDTFSKTMTSPLLSKPKSQLYHYIALDVKEKNRDPFNEIVPPCHHQYRIYLCQLQ